MSDDPVYYNGYWYHRSNVKNIENDALYEQLEANDEAIWNIIKEKLQKIAEEYDEQQPES